MTRRGVSLNVSLNMVQRGHCRHVLSKLMNPSRNPSSRTISETVLSTDDLFTENIVYCFQVASLVFVV